MDSKNLVKTFSRNLVTEVSLASRNLVRSFEAEADPIGVTAVSINFVTVTSFEAWLRYLVIAISSSY